MNPMDLGSDVAAENESVQNDSCSEIPLVYIYIYIYIYVYLLITFVA